MTPNASEPHRILVVDDDPTHLKLFQAWLELNSYEVTTAPSAGQALDHLVATKTPPQLILVDLMMPHMSGLDFLERLKDYVWWAAIPVVSVSAGEQTRHVGMADHLTKPVSKTALLTCVQNILSPAGSP